MSDVLDLSRPAVVRAEFAHDVIEGLSATPKTLPCRWFYDERGSELFEQITDLKEYYPTRTEIKILKQYGGDIAAHVGANADVVEYGAGALTKTRLLLDALHAPHSYHPIDISGEFLHGAARSLQRQYPDLEMSPIVANFLDPNLKINLENKHNTLGFFSGSTIGNLSDDEIHSLLCAAKREFGPDGKFLIGVDLIKSENILVPAYDDAKGVTAAFNLNIISRINDELRGEIDLEKLRHEARWNKDKSRIEMHLVAKQDFTAYVLGHAFRFKAGESIHTENSRKFSLDMISSYASKAGWSVDASWTDENTYYALILLASA